MRCIILGDDVQLDNRLLPEMSSQSKFEKLAEECRQPGYQLPCRPGQRWYCQLEQNRWRKHKCKQQLLLPSLTSRIFKKCACFTSKGLVYKKIPVSSYKFCFNCIKLLAFTGKYNVCETQQ